MSVSSLERRVAKLEAVAGFTGPIVFLLVFPGPDDVARTRAKRDAARKAHPDREIVWLSIRGPKHGHH